MAKSSEQKEPTNTAGNEATAATTQSGSAQEAGYEWPVADAGKWFEETVASKKLTILVYFRGHW